MNPNNISVLVLAYLGDSVYESYIREALIKKNILDNKLLANIAKDYVSAKGQAMISNNLINNFLSLEEIAILKRGRNHKSSHSNKNASNIEYKLATGLETLIGYLKLSNKESRIVEIINFIMENKYGI